MANYVDPSRREQGSRIVEAGDTFTQTNFHCCDGTVVINLEHLDNHQRCLYGTWAWKTDYNVRNPSENSNSMPERRHNWGDNYADSCATIVNGLTVEAILDHADTCEATIPVPGVPATPAPIDPGSERHRLAMAASGVICAGMGRVHPHIRDTSSLGFVSQYEVEGTPPLFRHLLGVSTGAEQSRNVEVLDGYAVLRR